MKHQVSLELQNKIYARNIWHEKSKHVGTQEQGQRITEHAITYFKQNGDVSVRDESIDFPKAKSEIEALRHGGYDHFIGFVNKKTSETIQFAHYEPDG